MRLYRQGDVLLQRVDRVPRGALPAPGLVPARIPDDGKARAWKAGEELYVTVADPTEVVHEQHEAIALEPGVWRVWRQRQYADPDGGGGPEGGAEVLDRDNDAGGYRELLRVSPGGSLWVSVQCPSTGKRHLLRVPPDTLSCRAAVAWVAGFDDPEDYSPVRET